MSALGLDIQARLRDAADSDRAPAQQAYMKSAMPYLGVAVPTARMITRRAVKDSAIVDADVLMAVAVQLWNAASHREERYAALAVLAEKPLRGVPALIPVIEHMVRTGQWWDYTDELAHRMAELLDSQPGATAAVVRRWSTDEDLWMRRIAIICQLGRHERVDRQLLVDTITPNLADPEFFIRKAIGWALREYAREHPDWVRHFVLTHELSPLSRREALKHL